MVLSMICVAGYTTAVECSGVQAGAVAPLWSAICHILVSE